MIGQQEADRIAIDWIAAWNAHDLGAILDHYADTLTLTPPLVVERPGRPWTGTQVAGYVALKLPRFPKWRG